MHGLISRLGIIHASEVVDKADASTLILKKTPSLIFEVTVPTNVLEWFVSAKDSSGVELWSDWADYYPLKSETREELQAQMAGDIKRFAAILASSEVRMTSVLEWKRDDVWSPVGLAPV